METKSTSVEKIDKAIAGLTTVKEWMEAHPEIEFVSVSLYHHQVSAQIASYGDTLGNFAAAVRALKAGAPVGSVTKDITESLYSVSRDFGDMKLDIYTARERLCEAKVVGTERVRVPDPDAPMVEIERDIIEWECAPLLVATDESVTV